MLPWVREWQQTYSGEDFQVISVHYPEFRYEKELENVRQAASDLEITFPIAIDNERLTWGAYNQRYWPTIYLIDKEGHIRYQKIGEGEYERTEAAIRFLLAEPDPAP